MQVQTFDWSYARLYLARELVFTRNKLIVFTTSWELSHYVVLKNNDGKESRHGSQVDVFSFYVYIRLFLWILCTYFVFENETNIPFNLIISTFICTVCTTLHLAAAIFISWLVEVHNSPPVDDWWLRDLEFRRTFWDGSACCVYSKLEFKSPAECSITLWGKVIDFWSQEKI